jgi:gentisate 1,2-dioxygenase
MAMSEHQVNFIDLTDRNFPECSPDGMQAAKIWAPVLISKKEIALEVERLADLPRPANGRRQTRFVHPSAPATGQGLTPGVKFTLDVLKPGEKTEPIRHNSTQVNFCIQGGGHTLVDGRKIEFAQYDVWNHPSWRTYQHVNDSKKLQVRFTYSNAALLEMMRVHIIEENPPAEDLAAPQKAAGDDPRSKSPFGTFEIGEDGASLMPYETLINPPSVASKTLHWPWVVVNRNLDKLASLGKDYIGRRLYLLHNPMTGRFNGTTPNFFATITIRPPGIIDRPHRHVSSAINYYFSGKGYSVVDKKRYEWEAGDLMVSAPGWAVHNHASHEDGPVRELTIQDQPLNIFMESLLWQESMKGEAVILGANPGFLTNR